MKLIFEGHACFRVICGGKEILVDPYISANPLCQKDAAEFSPDLILVTHGHGDHLGDALPIARRCGAVLAGQVDLLNAIDCAGVEKVGFNLGGTFDFQGVRVTMVPAWHGNGIAGGGNNVYAGLACGYIIDDGERKLYHAGDTALFGDMVAVKDAGNNRAEHRRNISAALQFVKQNDLIRVRKHIQYFDAGDSIKETVVGIVTGMMLSTGGIRKDLPMIAFADADDGIKVSARADKSLGEKGLDLSKVMSEASEKVGGYGGGHNIAAGATIPEECKERFLDIVEDMVRAQLT